MQLVLCIEIIPKIINLDVTHLTIIPFFSVD